MRHLGSVAGVGVAVTVLTGCGEGRISGNGNGNGNGERDVVDGGTFTLAVNSDPGNPYPQASAAIVFGRASHVAYDSLVATDPDGGIVSQLADSWKIEGQQVTLTLSDGITCVDGLPFTPEDAAAALDYVADAANSSPLPCVFVPSGATATASGSAVTEALASPDPVMLDGVSVVCQSGLADRFVLAHETCGTGPYRRQEAHRGRVSDGANRAPLKITASAARFACAAAVSRELGLPKLGAAAVVGASDGNCTAGIGVSTLDGLGATGGGAHAQELVSELAGRAALAADLLAGLQLSTATKDVPSSGVHRP